VPRRTALATSAPKTSEELDAFLYDANELESSDPDAAHRRIIDQVLSASTPDAVLTPVDAIDGAQVLGVPLLLFSWAMNKSEFDAGSPFYASMQCADLRTDPASPVVVNCGHKRVLAQLVKLQEFDQYPYQVMFRTRGQSRHGTPMLELVKWEPDDSDSENSSPPF
jgi:hypothetical protein